MKSEMLTSNASLNRLACAEEMLPRISQVQAQLVFKTNEPVFSFAGNSFLFGQFCRRFGKKLHSYWHLPIVLGQRDRNPLCPAEQSRSLVPAVSCSLFESPRINDDPMLLVLGLSFALQAQPLSGSNFDQLAEFRMPSASKQLEQSYRWSLACYPYVISVTYPARVTTPF